MLILLSALQSHSYTSTACRSSAQGGSITVMFLIHLAHSHAPSALAHMLARAGIMHETKSMQKHCCACSQNLNAFQKTQWYNMNNNLSFYKLQK